MHCLGVLILSLVGRTWSPDFVLSSTVKSTIREGFDASGFLDICLVERCSLCVPLLVGRQALHPPSPAATSS